MDRHPRGSMLAVLALAGATLGMALAMGPALAPASAPEPPEARLRPDRAAEAAAKAQSYAALLKSEAAVTPNQQQWDALAYELHLTLSPSTHILQGVVTCTAVVASGPLASLELDLSTKMTVSAVTSGGAAATWGRAGDLLTVDLDHAYAAGDTARVTVTYQGDPAGDYFGWNLYGGQPLIWSLSEPWGARDWWPCKDTPSDKADTVDMWVTVPDGLIVASNGNLLGQTVASGQRTFHWREGYPIATYLVSVAIHPYVVLNDSWQYAPGQTMPIVHYVVPDRVTQAQTAFAVTPAMLQAFSDAFGLYPFVQEKYGHAHFPWGGGMEHQTLTSMYYNVTSPGIIAHELSHQWWGDLVTCADFHHIWLNEGFATWCEAYWREVNEGPSGYRAEMDAAAYYGPGTIYVDDETDVNRVFDYYLSYNKASWVVHMLRGVLGDEDFFAALRAWAGQRAYASGRTEDFQAVCEQQYGGDLGWFFQEWIYGQYYPVYEYSWYSLTPGDSTTINVNLKQRQTNAGLFTMPLELQIATSEGPVRARVFDDQADQNFRLRVAGTPLGVVLDPDHRVLCQYYQGLSGTPPASPAAAVLGPNRPNPFNPSTTIVFELPRRSEVRLSIRDLAGRHLRTLVEGVRAPGRHEAVWDGRDARGRDLPSGIYVYQLQVDGQRLTRKMSLLR